LSKEVLKGKQVIEKMLTPGLKSDSFFETLEETIDLIRGNATFEEYFKKRVNVIKVKRERETNDRTELLESHAIQNKSRIEKLNTLKSPD
jgi:hypothetical protein